MNRVEIAQAGAQFAAELAGLGQTMDVNVLLAPDNLLIGEKTVSLRSKTPVPGAVAGVYPGFSAPEVHAGTPAPNSGVYFAGAVLYMLITGNPPPPAPARQPGPLLGDGKLLSQVVNQALEPDPKQRFASFAPLEGALKAVLAQAQAPAAAPAAAAGLAAGAAAASAPPPAGPANAPQAMAQPPQAPPAQAAPAPAAPPPAPAAQPAPPPAEAKAPPAAPQPVPMQAAPVQAAAAQASVPPPVNQQAQPPAGGRPGGPAPSGGMPPVGPSNVPPPASAKAQPYTAPGQPPAPPMGQPAPQRAPGAPGQPPFAGAPAQGMAPPPIVPPPPPKKKKKKTGLIVTLCVVGVLLLAVGGLTVYTFIQKGNADTAYTESRFTDYVSTVDSLPWLKMFMGSEADLQYGYARVRSLMEEGTNDEVLQAIQELDEVEGSATFVRSVRDDWVNKLINRGEYEDAMKVTDSLKGHSDSADLSKEVQYKWAKGLLNDGEHQEALDMLDKLGNYKDSVEMAQEVRYDWAISLMNEGDLQGSLAMFELVGDYLDSWEYMDSIDQYIYADSLTGASERFNAFNQLGDFLDAAQKADAAAADVYASGVELYNSQSFDDAYSLLSSVYSYKDAGLYVQAMDLYYENSANRQADAYYSMDALREISYSIDVRPVVMTTRMLWGFLIGEWISDDGGGSFTLSSSEYDFTNFNITGYYVFDDKSMIPDTGNSGPGVYFEFINFDEIYVNVTDPGDTYHFYRV